jgi:hypothetical protein
LTGAAARAGAGAGARAGVTAPSDSLCMLDMRAVENACRGEPVKALSAPLSREPFELMTSARTAAAPEIERRGESLPARVAQGVGGTLRIGRSAFAHLGDERLGVDRSPRR